MSKSLLVTIGGLQGNHLGKPTTSLFEQKAILKRRVATKAMFNPESDPILKKAIQEPVAFFGGFVAGILRLDLSEDPLREWVTKTAEAAGVSETIGKEGAAYDADEAKEDGPVEIDIE